MPLLKQTTLSKQCSNVYKMSLVRQSSSLAASLDPFRSSQPDVCPCRMSSSSQWALESRLVP